MRSSFSIIAFVVVSLLVGLTLRPLHDSVASDFHPGTLEIHFEDLEPALGEGFMLAFFGGLRSVLADLMWIQAYIYWEEKDIPKTESTLAIVTTLKPDSTYFWLNAARIIALDMPAWIFQQYDPRGIVPELVERRVRAEQAQIAIDFLEGAFRHLPNHPLILVEQGRLHYFGRSDPEAAAELYGKAALLPNAPFYAGRLHAILLENLNREEEAYRFLVKYYQTLPEDHPSAQKPRIRAWIESLEDLLNIPAEERAFWHSPGEGS